MTSWTADERYTALVHAHGNELLKLAIMLCGNVHDAHDVLQDVVIGAARAWPMRRPLPYLRQAIANRAMDVSRRRREFPTDELPDRAIDDALAMERDDARAFAELVRALPERQRLTVVLTYMADLDDRTIARMLDSSIATVRSNRQRALTALRAQMSEKERVR